MPGVVAAAMRLRYSAPSNARPGGREVDGDGDIMNAATKEEIAPTFPGYIRDGKSGPRRLMVPCQRCSTWHEHGLAGAKAGDVIHRAAHCSEPSGGHYHIEIRSEPFDGDWGETRERVRPDFKQTAALHPVAPLPPLKSWRKPAMRQHLSISGYLGGHLIAAKIAGSNGWEALDEILRQRGTPLGETREILTGCWRPIDADRVPDVLADLGDNAARLRLRLLPPEIEPRA